MVRVMFSQENKANPVLQLAGYHGLELLYEGSKSQIIRAKRDGDELPVIIKQVYHSSLVDDNIKRLRHEYHLLCDLEIPGIIKPILHQQNDGMSFTVFNDHRGVPLRHFKQTQPYNWERLLPLIKHLSKIAGRIHEAGIIHKQITPNNILLNNDTGAIEFIDFTLATTLDSEEVQPESVQVNADALPYIAPEQSGRINRRIDFRTDFYSLGATIYELIVGHPPFVSKDKLELIHSHIARHPIPLSRIDPTIPQAVSDIIQKLLAKDASQRYQSTFGLTADIDECIRQQHKANNIKPFAIASQDRPERFLIPEHLYGRDEIIKQLLGWYETTLKGKPQTVLISGYSGIGKSTLVNEIREHILEQNGTYVSGKFDQFSRRRPYSAIIFALQSLIKQLLTEPEEMIDVWRSRLQLELGINAPLMIRLIPELDLIIGRYNVDRRLPSHQEQNLISRLFVRLIEIFAAHDRVLVLFLDDLQWADTASFNIIKTLSNINSSSRLMLIASYRDQDIGPTHPIRLLIDGRNENAEGLKTVKLDPLNQDQIENLLADTLHCEPSETHELSIVCQQKTQGNPFFLKQFLSSLHHQKLIFFRQGKWRWDEGKIGNLELADDVITLLVTRIKSLPKETQQVLKLAACIGSRFNLKTLSVVYAQSHESTIKALWPSLTDDLIIPLDEHYQTAEAGTQALARYRFIHDRVQQAAYSLVLPEQRQNLHLRIGQYLKDSTPNSTLDKTIFDITNHLNLAVEIINQPHERIQLAELNLRAGIKARESAACEGSAEHFQRGLTLLPTDCWSSHYETSLAIHTAAAESAFMRSEYSEMDRLIHEILSHAYSLEDKLKIHELRIQAETARNRFDTALDIALEVLKLLGVQLPSSPTKLQIQFNHLKTQWALNRTTEVEILNAPAISNQQVKATLPILTSMFGIVKFSSSSLRPLVMAKQVELTLQYGLMHCSAQSFAGYGGMLCGYYDEIDKGYALGQLALKLDQQLPSRTTHHKTLFLHYTYIAHWKQPLHETLEPLLQGHHLALDCGDVEWGAYALATYIQYHFFLATNLNDEKKKLIEYLHQIRLSGQKQSEEYSLFTLQTVDNLLGDTPTTKLEGEYYSESVMLERHKANNHRTAICLHYFYKALLHYLFAEYDKANTTCKKGMETIGYINGTYTSTYFIYLTALSEIALLSEQPQLNRLTKRKKISRVLKKIERLATYSAHNHQHHVLLIKAELYRISGKKLLAMAFYEQAISASSSTDFILDRALSYELAGRFYIEWGKPTLADSHIQKAWEVYRGWGAISKCNHMLVQYNRSFSDQPELHQNSAPSNIHEQRIHSVNNQNLDISSVLKATHTIADEIVLERILDRLITLAMENAGAQRSVLILNKDDQLIVAAEMDMNGHQLINSGTKITEVENSLPLSLIHYVSRTNRLVVFDSNAEDQQFIQDSYLRQKPPCSALCLPILYHGALTALLYLENSEARNVFTQARVETLKVLAAQAAISIETAKLYRSLEQSEHQFRSLVENAIEGIFRISPQGAIISANPALVELLGYDNQETFIHAITDIGTQCFYDSEHLSTILARLEKDKRVAGFESRWKQKNGTIIHVSISVRKVINELDQPIYYEGTIADISARKAREKAEVDRLESEIARQKAEAETLAKSQFLATMSHEIRTPMNGVLGMAQLLLKSKLTAQQNTQVEAIYESGKSLLDVLNSVLDFSKLEAQKMEFTRVPFCLSNSLQKLRNLLLPLAQEKGLQLTFDLADELPDQVKGDVNALHQILLNLCSNAIKFTHQGFIIVRVSATEQAGSDHLFRFEVEDSGVGIPVEAYDKIFQHFSQADSSITRNYGGTGLGLAICKQLVDQQRGEIGFTSNPGEGTCFWFELSYPLILESKQICHQFAIEPSLPCRILVVEDTPINQDVTVGLLAEDKHHVDVAEDGFRAIELVTENNYDLILMDIHLPKMDGMQTTHRIRQLNDPIKSTIPVIALTASVTEEEIAHYYQAGMDNVIAKPILFSTLRETINAVQESAPRCAGLPSDIIPIAGTNFLNHPLLSEHTRHLGHEQFQRLIDKYYLQADDLLIKIAEAMDQSDRVRVGDLVHKWIGASSNFGLAGLHEHLTNLEPAIISSSKPELNQQIDQARHIYQQSREKLEEYFEDVVTE